MSLHMVVISVGDAVTRMVRTPSVYASRSMSAHATSTVAERTTTSLSTEPGERGGESGGGGGDGSGNAGGGKGGGGVVPDRTRGSTTLPDTPSAKMTSVEDARGRRPPSSSSNSNDMVSPSVLA